MRESQAMLSLSALLIVIFASLLSLASSAREGGVHLLSGEMELTMNSQAESHTASRQLRDLTLGDNDLVGTPQDDELSGDVGDDSVDGGAGNDNLSGDPGDDEIVGGAGDDIGTSGPGNDKLHGMPGADELNGDPGDDTINGGDGDDTLDGGPGNDRMQGNGGNDNMLGGPGDDNLQGGAGADNLEGGPGDDLLDLGPAGDNDTATGGPGKDTVKRGIEVLCEDPCQVDASELGSRHQDCIATDCVAENGQGKCVIFGAIVNSPPKKCMSGGGEGTCDECGFCIVNGQPAPTSQDQCDLKTTVSVTEFGEDSFSIEISGVARNAVFCYVGEMLALSLTGTLMWLALE